MANWLGPMGRCCLNVQGTKPGARTLPKEYSESWGGTASRGLSFKLSDSSEWDDTHQRGINATATNND